MMKRICSLFVGAVLLQMVAGCSLDSLTQSFTGKPHMDQVFNGPLAVVSMTLQQTLTDYHIKYTTSVTDNDTVKLIGTTVTDDPFTLVLKKVKSENGEKTQARMEWDKNPNEDFWTNLVQVTIKNLNSFGITPNEEITKTSATSAANRADFGMGLQGIGKGTTRDPSLREPPGPITPEERQSIFGIK